MPERRNPPSFTPPAIDFQQFHRLFFEETQDNLDQLERLLLDADWQAITDEHFHALFRCAHSIKGSAATFGFDDIARLAHDMEGLLDAWRKRITVPNRESVDHMLAGADVVRAMVQSHAQDVPLPPEQRRRAEQLGAWLGERRPDADSDAAAATQPVATHEESASAPVDWLSAAEGEDGFGWFDGAPGAPEGESAAAPTRPLDAGVAHAAPLPGSATQSSQPEALSVSAHELGLQANETAQAAVTVRVPIARIDGIVDLLGELIVAQTALQQAVEQLDKTQRSGVAVHVQQQQRLVRALRDAVMQSRMVPASQLFQRMPRLVHDLSHRLGKSVVLHTEGDATELDKGVIERITDPLTHLVRNCMDHGFEPEAERLAAGKSASGQLRLSARHEGGDVVIQVRDDGRGLSRERLLARGRALGLVLTQEATDAEVWQLAMQPGLSTSAQVSDISGRGVGMDVVRRNIESLGGRIEIDSTAEQGTCVTLWLPLTLAITDGLLVRVGPEHYVLPMSAVQESMPAAQVALQTVQRTATLMPVQHGYCPVVALDGLLGVERASGGDMPDQNHQEANATLVVLRAGTQRVAVLVDTLVGQQQVVVKNIETHYRKVPFVSAATLLGDGSVALILDAAQLARIRQPQAWLPSGGAGSTMEDGRRDAAHPRGGAAPAGSATVRKGAVGWN